MRNGRREVTCGFSLPSLSSKHYFFHEPPGAHDSSCLKVTPPTHPLKKPVEASWLIHYHSHGVTDTGYQPNKDRRKEAGGRRSVPSTNTFALLGPEPSGSGFPHCDWESSWREYVLGDIVMLRLLFASLM